MKAPLLLRNGLSNVGHCSFLFSTIDIFNPLRAYFCLHFLEFILISAPIRNIFFQLMNTVIFFILLFHWRYKIYQFYFLDNLFSSDNKYYLLSSHIHPFSFFWYICRNFKFLLSIHSSLLFAFGLLSRQGHWICTTNSIHT